MAALTDPIADLLTRVRNGLSARHEKIDVPSSRLKIEIARILKDEGYLKNFKVLDDKGAGLLRLYLKYDDAGNPVIHGLTRVSRPAAASTAARTSSRASSAGSASPSSRPRRASSPATTRASAAWAARSSARSGKAGR